MLMLRATPQKMDLSRRQWLRGDPRGPVLPRRPPWACDESLFIQRCTRCDRCIEACELKLLFRGSGGFPEIRFTEAGCDFCGDCLKACPNQALDAPLPAPSLAWKWRATIGARCLSRRGIVCRACGDACETEAIRFRLLTGGRAEPELDTQLCNGCGECLAVCPEQSITLDVPDSKSPIDEECSR